MSRLESIKSLICCLHNPSVSPKELPPNNYSPHNHFDQKEAITIKTTTNMSLPKTYKQAAFKEMGGPLVLEQVPLKLPGKGEILVKVEACGVCHSDMFPKHNAWGAGFPLVPGHEYIGKVAAVGEGITGWKEGDGIGGCWHGGMCETCDNCKQGLYQFCQPYIVNGVTKNGGCEYPSSTNFCCN